MSYQLIIEDLIKEFELNKNDDQAKIMSAYMKNKFKFYGIKSPERKEISKSFIKILANDYGESYNEITRILWLENKRELHYVAMDFLLKTKKYWGINSINLFEFIIINKSWWDTVDFIATNLVGNYILKFHPDNYHLMRDWNKNRNMWIIRVSILFQLKFKEKTNWNLLQENILNHNDSTEFFIRKAMGWALREYSKKESNQVITFIEKNPDLSGLTRREALKWINKN